MPLHGRHWAGLALTLLASTAAQAQSTLLSTPWYLGAAVGGAQPESLRDLEPGPGGRLLVGIPLRPQAFLEVSGFGFTADGKGGRGKEDTLGGGLDLKLESLGDSVNFLFVAGGGYAQAKREGQSVSAPYANIGWGVEVDLAPSLALRTEVRGLARFQDGFIANRGVTYDGLLTVGLTKRFGATPKVAAPYVATPPATPPPAVPTAPFVPPLVAAAPAGDGSSMPLRSLDLSRCASAPDGMKADDEGCLVSQRAVLPRTRLFEGDSARLTADADDLLAPLVVSLRRDPSLRADIVVHTDTLGLQSTNLDLTVRMAEQIRDRLLAYGVSAGQINVEGAGESMPIYSEDNDASRARNRRIDIKLSR